MRPTAPITMLPQAGPLTAQVHPVRVALVCMPFSAADRPSIQIGLLAALAEQAGFTADTYHLNVDLAALVTPEDYHGLCEHRGHMTGEWLFAVAAFGTQAHLDDDAYFAAFPSELDRAARHGKDMAYLLHLRHEVLPRFIEDCLQLVDWGQYDLVGFTSTFQQNVASLALARRIKERHPHVKIVFGGANMEDEMGPEYARAFPFLDYVVVGEGDRVFPALLRCLATGESPTGLAGLVARCGTDVVSGGQAPPVRDLDCLPTPNYDEYFARVRQLGLIDDYQYAWMVPFESSRGCWWGQKHHCTFCGLNGLGMAYRAKSPMRVLAELNELARRHRVSLFEATDNIMDMKYVQEFFGTITDARLDYQFFYEVKANLTPAQLRALHRGGVRWIQPGIESLSSHVLQLMRKGSTMLQNVRLLKWCRYYRIRVSWNLIWGFPGETEEDYTRELAVLKLLSHLDAPHVCGRIWLERFSPYFVDDDQFPVRDKRPEASYRFVYPPHVDLNRVAYFFDYRMEDTLPDEAHVATQEWVREWQRRQAAPQPDTLFYRRIHDTLFIDDNRGAERRGTHVFYGPLATAYEFCSETMHTIPQVVAHVEARGEGLYSETEMQAALDEFCARGLMVSEDGRYLSLALSVNPNW